MNSEVVPSSLPSSVSTEETHPISLPLFFTSSSSSLKPLRERNRTNLKRRINLSRSQVLSNDFENEDNLSTTNNPDKTPAITINSQPSLPSTPTIHTYTELYSKTVSPTTPSPIHTTVTCSQVWERLASNEEHQHLTSPKPSTPPPPAPTSTSTSTLPTHISFSYDPSDDEEGGDLTNNDKDNFQYVPVSSQSKLVQFQFLTFAKQQRLDSNSDDNDSDNVTEDDDDDDDDDDDREEEETITGYNIPEVEEEPEVRCDTDSVQHPNQTSKKRKRSVSTTGSHDAHPSTTDDTAASSTVTKPPCTKKPKIKDPNANFQRLNMRKKHFSHAKKHQLSKGKRNAFYRRMRHAGGSK